MERDGVVEPVSIVFNTIFQYTSSLYTLWSVNYDRFFQHLCQSFGFTCTVQSNKSVEQTTLHHTFRLFHICHLGGVVGGLSYLKRCLQVLLFSFPAVLSCLLIHCLITFSALPHCPRAWLRLKLSEMTIHRNFNWGLSGEGRKSWAEGLGEVQEHLLRFASPLSFPAPTPFSIVKF